MPSTSRDYSQLRHACNRIVYNANCCMRSAYGEPAGSRPVEEEELIYRLSWFLPPALRAR